LSAYGVLCNGPGPWSSLTSGS